MVNAKNAVYREIEMNWGEITLPLKAGTPVGLNGQIANDSDAVGIVPQTVSVLPVVKSIRILVGGSVSLAEVNAAYGSALTKAAKESMSGIAFYGEDGTPEPNPLWDGEPVPGTLPAVEFTDAGKILTVDDDGNWVAASGGGGGGVLIVHMDRHTHALDKTWAEINAIFSDIPVFMEGNALLINTEEDVSGYFLYFADFYDAPTVAKITFKADTADGYPVAQI